MNAMMRQIVMNALPPEMREALHSALTELETTGETTKEVDVPGLGMCVVNIRKGRLNENGK